jgi:hypothetical protein
MYMERDSVGLLHITDDGIAATVDETTGHATVHVTDSASRSAMKRVVALIDDPSRWPTTPLPRIDVAPAVCAIE